MQVSNSTFFRILVRIAFFLVGLFFIIHIISYVLVVKISDEKMNPFFAEEANYDVLFTGMSHTLAGVYPMELWNDYGIASYNLGEAGNSHPTGYWLIKNAIEYTQPALIVVDIRVMDLTDELQQELQVYLGRTFDSFPLSVTKYETALDLLYDWNERLEFLFPFIKYHSRWSELTKSDFIPVESRTDMGSNHNTNVSLTPKIERVSPDDKLVGEQLSLKYLFKIIEMCQDKGIDVLLVEYPYPALDKEQRLANGVADIADKYHINYINFLQLDGVIDYDTDMADRWAHLNDSGAKKVSSYLGKYIRQHYDIADRRGDENYSNWDHIYEKYIQEKYMTLQKQTSLDDYLMLLADKRMFTTIYVKEDSKILEDDRMRKLFGNITSVCTKDLNIVYLDSKDSFDWDIKLVVKDVITSEIKDTAYFTVDKVENLLSATRQ